SSDRRDIPQSIQLLDPLLRIAHVVEEVVGLDPSGNGFDDRRAAHAGSQMDFNGSRKNALLEHIGEFAHLFARALESLLLRDIIDSQDLGKVSHILHRGRDLLDVGAVAKESSHLDALLNLLQPSPNVDGDETKKSEGQERECK